MQQFVIFFIAAFLLASCTCSAQDGKEKEEKIPVFNYVIDDPMDKAPQPADSQKMDVFQYLVPQFYYSKARKTKDTTYEFFCYDKHDSLMTYVYDYDSVYYFSLYKSYTDSTHTYRDKDGVDQFLPVSSIVKRYDRVGKDKWMTIEYPANKYGELRAFKNVITATDTERITNSKGDYTYLKIYHYYKLIK